MIKKRICVLVIALAMTVSTIPNFLVAATAADNVVKSPSTYEYKTEYGTAKWKKVSAIAAGQPKSGTRFRTGGGFYYTDGASVSVSATYAFGAPYNNMSVSVGFGSVGGTAYASSAPDKTHYWKLKVIKNVKARPYIVYRKLRYTTGAGWEKYSKGYTILDEKIDFTCVKVS